MGNRRNRIFKIDQKFFQPCDGVQDVEWLVG